jgi:hypothetical protein
VPINIAQFIPNNNIGKILSIAAAIIILVVAGYGIFKFMPLVNNITPSTTQALENASACVYAGFYYEVTIDDDPFRSLISKWPQKWYVSQSSDGKWRVNSSTEGLTPVQYNGTAFFISKEGEMGTNRHVAVPWEYRTNDDDESIRQLVEKEVQQGMLQENGYLYAILTANILAGNTAVLQNASAWVSRFKKSSITISGSHAYFGIGLTGSKINSVIDLQQAQVIAESGDMKKDVALIRLNSRKTPDYIVQMGAIYDLKNARVDESTLKPQDEELIIVGYPLGETVSDESFDGKELRPTMHKTTISKVPDDNQIQIQTVGIGGQSGSPVCDKKHRLVGVLCSGFRSTEVTFCCNIKHLVELYDKNKVRE